MKRYKQYLLEKTYSLDRDVNYIYMKSGLNELVSYIQNEDHNGILNFISGKTVNIGVLLYKFSSSELTNRQCKTAHKNNPITIRVGIFESGSFYSPPNSLLQLSVNSNALYLLLKHKCSFDSVAKEIGTNVVPRFKSEFEEANIKGTIYHELTHWLDDTFNNRMLLSRIEKDNLKGKHSSVNHTEFEVNSQIHKIKQLKKSTPIKEYNELDWVDLFQKLPSLMSNFRNFKHEYDYNVFIKSFVKRLDRENLLPTKIRKMPTYKEMRQILDSI